MGRQGVVKQENFMTLTYAGYFRYTKYGQNTWHWAHHGCAHLHNLSTVEAQLLVVVQHCIHVFDPDSIHWPVKQDPLAVWGGVGGTLPEELGQDAVLPLMTDRVKLAIQLTHGDALGVHHMQLYPASQTSRCCEAVSCLVCFELCKGHNELLVIVVLQ